MYLYVHTNQILMYTYEPNLLNLLTVWLCLFSLLIVCESEVLLGEVGFPKTCSKTLGSNFLDTLFGDSLMIANCVCSDILTALSTWN